MRQRLLVGLLLLLSTGLSLYALVSIYDLIPSSSPASHQPALAPNALRLQALTPAASTQPPVSLGFGTGTEVMLNGTMADALQGARIGVLRFGDIFADDFDWQQGCIYGNVGSRHECYGLAGQNGKLDQFLAFTGKVGARPLIVVNGEIDDPQQAAGLVAYYWQHCLHAPRQPCRDPYWEIGDSPANWRHFAVPLKQRQSADALMVSPDQYAALVTSYAAAMAHAAPYYQSHHIQIVADEWITGATDESWISTVSDGGIDTHYAPLLYSSPGAAPSAHDVIASLSQEQGASGRPGIDIWLQDLRDSLAQFSQSGSLRIIIGRWSIDANAGINEPAVYSGYVQALFTASMLAHIWQGAQAGGTNPIVMAIQAPIAGQAQEPFDITTAEPRAAVAVYTLLGRYFGSHPMRVELGAAAQKAGIVAAGSLAGQGDVRILLVNTDQTHPHTIELPDVARGDGEMWWIIPDAGRADGVQAIQHMRVRGGKVAIPASAIAVVRLVV